MRGNVRLFLVCVVTLGGCTVLTAFAQTPDCHTDKAKFRQLSEPLLYGNGHVDNSAERYEKVKKAGTERVKRFISTLVMQKLKSEKDPAETKAYLECVAGLWGDLSNTPMIRRESGDKDIAVSALLIARGGGTVMDTQPVIECFSKKSGNWSEVGEIGNEFEGRTLDVYPLASPEKDQSWYLVSGRKLGDSGGRLLVEVAACDGLKFQVKWRRDGLRWGKAAPLNEGKMVELSFEKLDSEGRVQLPPPPPTREVLYVTSKGLE